MSKLSVDELNGRQTAGSITLSLENDNSQILQQGVVKATVSAALDGTVANADASLNISGVADGSAGLNTITVTNPFSAAKAAVPSATIHDGSYARAINVNDASASAFITRAFVADSGGLTDDNVDTAVVIHGDLA
tara:strand:+ start:8753 stop:9157 length:405 start_codon:yes stop_codon:yes gene_type:complete